MRKDSINIIEKLTEGIHLVAYVRSPYDKGVKTIEDNDYSSKKEFARDLENIIEMYKNLPQRKIYTKRKEI